MVLSPLFQVVVYIHNDTGHTENYVYTDYGACRYILDSPECGRPTPVAAVLSADTSDSAIAAFAAANGWVAFTNDDDFFQQPASFGLIVYSQVINAAKIISHNTKWHFHLIPLTKI